MINYSHTGECIGEVPSDKDVKMKNIRMKRIIFFLVTMVAFCGAQAQQRVVADKIIAIVGDKIILQSDIKNMIEDLRRGGETVPPNAECAFLQQALATKALILQAEKDSLPISDEDIEAELDMRIREYINRFGSKENLEEVSGKSVYQLKETTRPSIRERNMAEAMRNNLIKDIRITPSEVKAFFDKIPKDSLAHIESELEIGEIAVYPKASRDIELLSQEELNNYKAQVEGGTRKFEMLADLYSDDLGTQKQGGTLLINRTEQNWDPTFKAAVFRLKEGQISPVIKSKFGFHIIQLVSRNGDDALVRHILKVPQITQDEVDESISKLDSVRSKLIAGTLDFGTAVSLYSDDEFGKFNTGGIKVVTIDMLDKELVANLDKLKVGEYSKPMPYVDERTGRKAVRIVYIRSKTEPHILNLRDDYNKVAEMARQEKEYDALENWFNTRLPQFYIKLDEEYKGCPEIEPWIRAAQLSKSH